VNLSHLFGGNLSPGANGRFIQQTGGAMAGVSAPLSGEADVMMISGLNAAQTVPTEGGVPVQGVNVGVPLVSNQLSQPITIGPVTLPLWQWFLLAALLGGAGGYYLGRR
jgi:hypothetical protein